MTPGKKLVVYYSLEGNTMFIAEVIAEATGADQLELQPDKEPKSKGFTKYLWGGRQVFMKDKPLLKSLDKNPADYDLLFIGSPVWSWNYAPALRSFFPEVKLEGKKIGLFCCHQGSPGKTLENMKKELGGNTILGEKDFRQPLADKKQNKEKAQKWAKEIIEAA